MEADEPRTGHSQYPSQSIPDQDQYDQGREYSYSREPRDPRDTRDPRDFRDPRDPREYRNIRDSRDPRELAESNSASAMAAAALISPNTPYYPHYSQSAYSAGHYHQSPSHTYSQAQSQSQSQGHTPPSAPGMISPVESRRTSDDHEMNANRQSLPSIQEVIGSNASSFPPSGGLPQPPPPPQSQSSLPSPFTTNAPSSRPFPGDAPSDSQPSPHTMHHAPSAPMYGPRPGPVSSFPEPLRPQQSQSGRPQPHGPHPSSPPLPGIEPLQDRGLPSAPPPPHHLSQPPHPQQHAQQHAQQHSQQHPPHHSHHSSHSQQHPGPPPPLSQQPPHQRPPPESVPPPHHSPYHHGPPLPPPPQRDGRPEHDDSPLQHPAYPHMSSQHPPYPPPTMSHQQLPPPGQHVQSPYPGSPRYNGQSALPSPYEQHPNPMDQSQDFNRPRARYDNTVNKHFEAWSYAEYLARIGSNARTVFNFAEAFGSIAREEHGPQPMPGRMPSDREVVEMISNAEWLKTMLENLRGIVQQTVVNERGPNRQKPASYDDMDTPLYNEPSHKPFTLNEVKKRRGRAAPPGRCHSCNRIDTPEWRRGPDGARTLCNACGLHYAKLERKKQLENRQIRPKHPDEQRH